MNPPQQNNLRSKRKEKNISNYTTHITTKSIFTALVLTNTLVGYSFTKDISLTVIQIKKGKRDAKL